MYPMPCSLALHLVLLFSLVMSDSIDKICLIVGSTTNIGKETAQYLTKNGWTIK